MCVDHLSSYVWVCGDREGYAAWVITDTTTNVRISTDTTVLVSTVQYFDYPHGDLE